LRAENFEREGQKKGDRGQGPTGKSRKRSIAVYLAWETELWWVRAIFGPSGRQKKGISEVKGSGHQRTVSIGEKKSQSVEGHRR